MPKSPSQPPRPPPLPTEPPPAESTYLEPDPFSLEPPNTPSPARGGAMDRVKAFLAIQGLRAAGAARSLVAWVRRRPAVAAVAGAVVVAVAVAAGIAIHRGGSPSGGDVADAREAARARPDSAAAQRDLGHALWAKNARHDAVASYARALALDGSIADREMVANLVASFGTREQRDAEDAIVKHQVVASQGGLEALLASDRYGVRWGAVHTLDKLGKGSRANWESAYIADLGASDCRIRRAAVAKLGAIGTDRAVQALRTAKAQEKQGHAKAKAACLGDRVDKAERKILARR